VTHASLVRAVRFHATHHYALADEEPGESRRLFGDAVEPHAHDYLLEVTVRGSIDDRTGGVVDLGALDSLLSETVVERFDGADLNEEIPPVRRGQLQPTTEALARWFFDLLAPRIPGDAQLVRLRLAESEDLAAVYEGEGVAEAPGRG